VTSPAPVVKSVAQAKIETAKPKQVMIQAGVKSITLKKIDTKALNPVVAPK
jgi:hypothetical protein